MGRTLAQDLTSGRDATEEDAKRLRVVFARLSSRSDGGTILRAKRRRSDESVEPREEVGRREGIVDARGETVGDGGVESGRAGARGRNVFRWREVVDVTIINKELRWKERRRRRKRKRYFVVVHVSERKTTLECGGDSK